jgi:hypothetical protein
MGSSQPEKNPEASRQQLSRQVQVAVTDALRTLDKVKAVDGVSQDEVDSLRSVVWSDLTGLESEFGREDGPRPELLDRFFGHLLSNGDHIGQIELLAETLLGGAPPSQPPPDSPVAGLFRLHGSLMTIHQQWQELAAARPVRPPVVSAPSVAAPPPVVSAPPVRREAATRAKDAFFDEMGMPPSRQEVATAVPPRGRPRAERPSSPPRQGGQDRFYDDMGFNSPGAPTRPPDADTPRPRVIASFIVVFVILAVMAGGVIWLGLNGGPSSTGIVPTAIPTFNFNVPTSTPKPTATLSSAAPQLQITGNPLIVPCPGKGTSGFVLRNVGGQKLNWAAKVNRAGGSAQPVALSSSSGSLYGSPQSGTDAVTVTVTANAGNITGSITITTNIQDTEVITYQVQNC